MLSENRRVGTHRDLDTHGWLGIGRSIILFKPAAHLARLYSNHGVVSSSVIVWTIEKFDTNRAFLQRFGMLELVFDDVSKELLAASCVAEERAFQNLVQLVEDYLLLVLLKQNHSVRRCLNLLGTHDELTPWKKRFSD